MAFVFYIKNEYFKQNQEFKLVNYYYINMYVL